MNNTLLNLRKELKELKDINTYPNKDFREKHVNNEMTEEEIEIGKTIIKKEKNRLQLIKEKKIIDKKNEILYIEFKLNINSFIDILSDVGMSLEDFINNIKKMYGDYSVLYFYDKILKSSKMEEMVYFNNIEGVFFDIEEKSNSVVESILNYEDIERDQTLQDTLVLKENIDELKEEINNIFDDKEVEKKERELSFLIEEYKNKNLIMDTRRSSNYYENKRIFSNYEKERN